MLLATDIDGTFLGGELHHRRKLYNLLKNDPSLLLVFVTGRGLENVVTLFNDDLIPRPNYIICDVGATVVNGKTLQPVQPLQETIKTYWPGTFNILQHFKNIEWLQYQQVPQQRRCSFFLKDEAFLENAKTLAAQLNCDAIYSAGKFLDILPKGVNKGSTLTSLINHLQIPAEDVLVAGDTMNDLDMYKCGFKSVAVGGSEEALIKATYDLEKVYHAEAAGAGGIFEAMQFFEEFRVSAEPALCVASFKPFQEN
ncbi:HAD-IIB family hydrolase [Panacibacter ginsenosidivorans]|uniref:HAD-IIB family hydrolase n=1 Tax=Panacibacter ginsenosidivorans TaxID=1813871 RepID=A0A5B8VBA5_9BACT|nr:HAD-IIB family hydrolase [Panacibacter ginsenosidivorans]QEC68787.1 HAD-IIB family hydrolase [Panacibacter ginsenosidivorans]